MYRQARVRAGKSCGSQLERSRRASVPARSPKIISGKAGGKCLLPHHKVDEQPHKKPQKGYYSHKRRGSDDKNAVAIVKNCTTLELRLARLGCVGFSKR